MSTENERRADYGERALRAGSADFGDHGFDQEGVMTEVSDTIANLMHTCDRYEVDWIEAWSQGHLAYAGDHEDGPPPKSRDARELYATPEVNASGSRKSGPPHPAARWRTALSRCWIAFIRAAPGNLFTSRSISGPRLEVRRVDARAVRRPRSR